MKLIKSQEGLVRKKNTTPLPPQSPNSSPNRILNHKLLKLVQNARDSKHISHVV